MGGTLLAIILHHVVQPQSQSGFGLFPFVPCRSHERCDKSNYKEPETTEQEGV
jgi:hypothetical protein